jgi:hypothetical protein
MKKRHSTNNLDIEERNIGEGYVIVRPRRDRDARDGSARLAAPLDGGGGRYIPVEFEAGLFAPGLPQVWLVIKSAHHLRLLTGADESTFRDPVVQRVVIIADAFQNIPTDVRIPLATYARRAIAAAATDTWQEIESRPLPASGRLDDWELRQPFPEISRRPVGRPPRAKTLDLDKVRAAVDGVGPHKTKAVMERFHVSRSTAQRYRRDAGV